jgi:hypothetical protein
MLAQPKNDEEVVGEKKCSKEQGFHQAIIAFLFAY